MEYKALSEIPYFLECQKTVEAEGYTLIEISVQPHKNMVHVSLVIANKDAKKDIGLNDCSKVHHALQPKLLYFLGKSEDDFSMEVSSPGLERNIKNAAEFAFFIGRNIRVWDKNSNDWVKGIIKACDEKEVTLILQDDESEVSSENTAEKTLAYTDIAKAKFIHL